MIRPMIAIALATATVAPAIPAAAQTAMTPAQATATDRAVARGTLIYAYDQAAWHGTDDMLARIRDAKTRVGGWIVDGDAGAPQIIFYDRDAADPHAVYVATLRNGKIVDPRVLGEGDDRTLSPKRKAMIRARAAASAAAAAAGTRACVKKPFNSVVLPPETEGGPMLVYLLTPQTSNGSLPAGGHYRFEVSADGTVVSSRTFTKSCLELPTRTDKGTTTAMVVSHILDPTPTEIHVFTAFAAQLPLYVTTVENKLMWLVSAPRGEARIKIVEPKAAD